MKAWTLGSSSNIHSMLYTRIFQLHSYPYSDDVSLRSWFMEGKGPAVVGCAYSRNGEIVLCERVGLSV